MLMLFDVLERGAVREPLTGTGSFCRRYGVRGMSQLYRDWNRFKRLLEGNERALLTLWQIWAFQEDYMRFAGDAPRGATASGCVWCRS